MLCGSLRVAASREGAARRVGELSVGPGAPAAGRLVGV